MTLVQFESTTFGNIWVNPEHIVFISTQQGSDKAILWLALQNGVGQNGGGKPFQVYLEDAYYNVLTELEKQTT